jgi:hypothetical protein
LVQSRKPYRLQIGPGLALLSDFLPVTTVPAEAVLKPKKKPTGLLKGGKSPISLEKPSNPEPNAEPKIRERPSMSSENQRLQDCR